MKLRRLKNSEYEIAEARCEMRGTPLTTCPTCGSKPIKVRGDDERPGEAEGREYGTYRYMGQDHPCDCDTQMALRKHYLVANVGDQYMRLDWKDYRNEDIRVKVNLYLDKWLSFKALGMGIEFGGEGLGVGKTFAATYVAKELVKKGERVYFLPFLELISTYQLPDGEREQMWKRLRDTTVLVLDEVRPPHSSAQAWLFAERFEELVRHRTNFNLPTIIGTNLTQTELHEHYPRTYSLLSAKQMRLELTGADARASWIGDQNLDWAINDELPPIT